MEMRCVARAAAASGTYLGTCMCWGSCRAEYLGSAGVEMWMRVMCFIVWLVNDFGRESCLC